MDSELISAALADLGIPAVRFYPVIGSTNDAALEWSTAGAPDGAVVLADQQDAGRGRLNRAWVTKSGAALAVSMIFRPTTAETGNFSLFSPLAAVALQQVLDEKLNLPAEIKWPNDVLIRRKKVAGILTEAQWLGSRPEAVVMGIGINIAPAALPPPEALRFPATTIETELGRPSDRLVILHDLIAAVQYWRPRLSSLEFFNRWQNHLAFLQEPVQIESEGLPVYNGKVLGVDPTGNLRLLLNSGQEITVNVGDLRLRPLSDPA